MADPQFSFMPDGSIELLDQESGKTFSITKGPVFDALKSLADSKVGQVQAVDPGMNAPAPVAPVASAPPGARAGLVDQALDVGKSVAGGAGKVATLAEQTLDTVRSKLNPPKIAPGTKSDDEDPETEE